MDLSHASLSKKHKAGSTSKQPFICVWRSNRSTREINTMMRYRQSIGSRSADAALLQSLFLKIFVEGKIPPPFKRPAGGISSIHLLSRVLTLRCRHDICLEVSENRAYREDQKPVPLAHVPQFPITDRGRLGRWSVINGNLISLCSAL